MKFGTLKIKILTALTESFSNSKKKEVKDILNKIKSNPDFKELYLLYENIENKHFDDKDVAGFYVEELGKMLQNKKVFDKQSELGKFLQETDKQFKEVIAEENQVYSLLDTLCENDSLLNIDKKVIAKKQLVGYLTTNREVPETTAGTFTENEQLLHTVLANNFNIVYNHTLTEEQKSELKDILSLSNEDVENKVKELKETILDQVKVLIENENTESPIVQRLNDVKDEVTTMSSSKYNYYRLTQLKNGLN
jgi:hypothetical protein